MGRPWPPRPVATSKVSDRRPDPCTTRCTTTAGSSGRRWNLLGNAGGPRLAARHVTGSVTRPRATLTCCVAHAKLLAMPVSSPHRVIAALAIVVLVMLAGLGPVWAACCGPEVRTACCAPSPDVDEASAMAARCCCEVSAHDGPAQPPSGPAAVGSMAELAPSPGVDSVEPQPALSAPGAPHRAVLWTPRARVHLRNRVIQR
jgi:hypothetical protein